MGPETTQSNRETVPGLENRFTRKIRYTPDGCWKWAAARGIDGYGRIGNPGGRKATPRVARAHEYAYRQLIARYPKHLTLWPTCGDRLCVNPAHQELISVEEYERRTAGMCAMGIHLLDEVGRTNYGFCLGCRADRRSRFPPPPPPGPRMSERTHCPQGHPYEQDNTIAYRGKRFCRECHRLRCQQWRDKQKALSA